VVDGIQGTDTRAVLIAPSNPFLSIDPILAVPGIRAALMNATAPIVAAAPSWAAKP
jgi:LPPG:FO 2-phospho-L-lactate transferase